MTQNKEISIKKVLNFEQQLLNRVTGEFPIQNKLHYGNWLAQTYYFVCHSTRLLAAAASRFGTERNDLHLRFLEHTREERGHENLALNDLSQLGLSIEQFPELPATQAFYQTQYYWIEHISPVSFFGYILCLEAFSIGGGNAIYEGACQAFGEKAAVFLKVHVKEDVDHVEKAFQQLEQFAPAERQAIIGNLKLSCDLYAKIYEAILRSAPAIEPKLRRAA